MDKKLILTFLIIFELIFVSSYVSGDDPVNTNVYVNPMRQIVEPGANSQMTIYCVPGQPIKSYELQILFDPTLLTVNSVTEGNIFNGHITFFNAGTINNTEGKIVEIYGLIVGTGSVSNPGSLVSLSFTAKYESGLSTIDLSKVGVTNDKAYVPITVTNGTVNFLEYSLNVNINGSGSVIKKPNQGTYAYGTVVQLTATANTGCTFSSWGGNLSGNTNPTSVTMNGNKIITAHFLDIAPLQISGIARTTSNPLDTSPMYGWVNVSCTVTDNIQVSQMVLRIHNPNGSWNNVSMVAGAAGKYYYRSTTAFSTVGIYSYSIMVVDTSNNTVNSSTVMFSMPHNYDINMDGKQNGLDLNIVKKHFGETGQPGWIRVDVDNDGIIQVLDLVTMQPDKVIGSTTNGAIKKEKKN